MKTLALYRPSLTQSLLDNTLGGFDRYLDSFFGNNFLSPSERIFNRLPLVDVRETEKAYILEAEMPGYDEKDIEIKLDGKNLSIESKKIEEKKEEDSGDSKGNHSQSYLLRERRVSSFSRGFRLPENADPDGISASFKNGILSLEICKKAEAQAKLIEISKN
ncbi:MAG: Hsp20/alpha crystallin family protein [Treponema sp.]|nr:Hsp20/alpha crystallin family protein [Treponema sp.]